MKAVFGVLLLWFLLMANPCYPQGIEIPYTNDTAAIIKHKAFSLLYNDKYKQAEWVAYLLTREMSVRTYPRANSFKKDPNLPNTDFSKDYKRSGYDRGHLAPAGDMAFSKQSMNESFYYTNISPQNPDFNRRKWKELENLVRTWAVEHDSLYVVTGPVLQDGLPKIGNGIAVPHKYYKAILYKSGDTVKGIGFLLSNRKLFGPLRQYIVPIDSIEEITGLNFFPTLSEFEELMVEKGICKECWTW